jgi:hypothetical protein
MDRSSTTSGSGRSGTMEAPVDNATYNLLQTLTSKLEAIDAYKTYERDAEGDEASIYRELADQDRRAAERLLEAVKERLSRR